MSVQHDTETRPVERAPTVTGGARSALAWVMGIIGAVALFLGLFISFAGEDQYVGIGGDWSWRVGDITSAWQYGFLIGGGVLLIAAIAVALMGRSRTYR